MRSSRAKLCTQCRRFCQWRHAPGCPWYKVWHDLLLELHDDKGLSTCQIGRILGIRNDHMCQPLRFYGIPARKWKGKYIAKFHRVVWWVMRLCMGHDECRGRQIKIELLHLCPRMMGRQPLFRTRQGIYPERGPGRHRAALKGLSIPSSD